MAIRSCPQDREQRLTRARAALAKAQAATGVQPLREDYGQGAVQTGEKHHPDTVAITPTQATPLVPISDWKNNLRGVTNGGGQIWHLTGGNEQLLDAVAHLTTANSWSVFIGVANIGWCAAFERGIVLEKTVVVSEVTTAPAPALIAAIDSFDLLVCGPLPLLPRQQRVLAARIRTRRITCLTTAPWPGISQLWDAPVRIAQKVG